MVYQGAEVYQGGWGVSTGVSPVTVVLWFLVRHWAEGRAVGLRLCGAQLLKATSRYPKSAFAAGEQTELRGGNISV